MNEQDASIATTSMMDLKANASPKKYHRAIVEEFDDGSMTILRTRNSSKTIVVVVVFGGRKQSRIVGLVDDTEGSSTRPTIRAMLLTIGRRRTKTNHGFDSRDQHRYEENFAMV